MSTVNVEIELLPVCRDSNGNPIVPLELINIKNKVKYIKEKTDQLLHLNKSTINEREIEIQIVEIKDYLDRVMNMIASLKNQYKERLNGGYLKEKIEKEYGCTQEEWDNFIENAENADFSELINKLLNVFGNVLEYAKKENMGEEAIDAIRQDIANINSSKNIPSIMREEIAKLENGMKIEVDRYIPPGIRREVWRRDRGQCVQCGSRLNLEFDHIIPVSKGGSNTSRNIQLLCESCNREKYNNI